MFDLLITNAQIIDGTGKASFKGSVAISDGIIAEVFPHESSLLSAKKVIDAKDSYLSPGFIDTHAHSDLAILNSPDSLGKISQGVTTEISGNCGLSPFPLTKKNRDHLTQLYAHYNVELSWNDFSGFRKMVENANPAINTMFLCGHNSLRSSVAGYSNSLLTKCELRNMLDLHSKLMDQGVAGTSTGLLYVPGKFADETELNALGMNIAKYSKPFVAHIRSEGNQLIESITEFANIAKFSKINHIHISHLKVAGKSNWSKIDKVLDKIDELENMGIRVTADRYPYTESMTQLSAYMPSPISEMDDVAVMEYLKDPANFADFLSKLNQEFSEYDWGTRRVVSTNSPLVPPSLLGLTFAELGEKINIAPAELCCMILRDDSPGTMGSAAGMDYQNMLTILKQSFVCCGSDEIARPLDFSIGRGHPRGFDSFPEFIRQLLPFFSLEEIIAKITSFPVSIFNIPNRGFIKKGYSADLVLFSLEDLRTSQPANFANPHKLCDGIEKVIINGEVSYLNKTVVKRVGKVL